MGESVWRAAAFLGAFGDPYLRNTPYEFGGNPQALVATLDALQFIFNPSPEDLADNGEPSATSGEIDGAVFHQRPLGETHEHFIRETLLPRLAQLRAWTDRGLKVTEPKHFQAFLTDWRAELLQLPLHTPMFVPGGFVGTTLSHTMIYIIEKTHAEEYSFTVCNKGPGAEMYHPTTVGDPQACDKILVQPYLQITRVPSQRFLDMAFWSLLFSLWIRKPPSEYHRIETIYDVLLPWLAGDKLLPLALEESIEIPTSGTIACRTPQRSNLGYFKSLIEAIRFLCLSQGSFSTNDIKFGLLYKLRYRLFRRLLRDLEIARDPAKGVPQDALENAMQVLTKVSLLDALQGNCSLDSVPDSAVVGVYFAKAANAASIRLTKLLTSLTQRLQAQGKHLVIIVVSVDHDQAEYDRLIADLPVHSWLIVPFPEVSARKQLVEAFNIMSIPTLVLRDPRGHVLTPKGKELIESDPIGEHFPWNGKDFALPTGTITFSEGLCIEMSIKQVTLKTLKQHQLGNLSTEGLEHVNSLIVRADELVAQIRLYNDTKETTPSTKFPAFHQYSPHSNMELLQVDAQDSRYAGNAAEFDIPMLGSFLDVPERVSTITLAVGAFVRCRGLCESLLRRAADGSSSSRISLHHEVIQLITSLFVEVLPSPKPSGNKAHCMWRQPVTKDMQMKCLTHVYSALMLLGNVWQSIEQPSRQFDSERSLAALCGLAIFDALLKTPAQDEQLAISRMLHDDGGYVLAHRFCKPNFTLKRVTSSMEFTRPNFCVTRGNMLAYFDDQDQECKHQLFEYHMPEDKLEIKKYSTTLIFFRRLMEEYNYQLIDSADPNPPTEMEALMEWFCGDDSPMSRDHPEVPMTRDLVMIVKFLVTMETKEVELMRRRNASHQWQMWQLSFDDSSSTQRRNFFGSRGLDRMLNGELKWEIANFRGSDQDIADVDVVGFMERKLYFGEGPVVVSPTDMAAVLASDSKSASSSRGLPHVVTEDDIMHLDFLPTFNGTLSSEESEYLMSYLTVPYARIPLVISFFSCRDRVTYLFNPLLQGLFRAVLFECGDWVSDSNKDVITHLPLRKSSLLLREEAVARVFDARIQHQRCDDHLGTMNGLLLNELLHAPDAVISPLLRMLHAIQELGEASVHSADARFILFMIKVGMDVLRFATFVVDFYEKSDRAKLDVLVLHREKLVDYAFGFAFDTLDKWRREAEESNNLQTACVIHSYIILLFVGLRPSEYTAGRVSKMIGSISYVRNWHCFGMKVSAESNENNGLSAEDRLLRWLQAQGINTENVSKSSLDKYLRGRPLYLKIGMQTIQAPSIIALRGVDGEVRLPPSEVLEAEVFEALQIHRRSIIKWMGDLTVEDRSIVLGSIVRIALRSSEPDSHWSWSEGSGAQNVGRYTCQNTELKIDIQTGEILWRNDELKPVPDTMTQYSDFKTIFGSKSLHCGLVVRQEHRLWIKIVGTEYELVEWDDPTDPVDQGVGAPTVYDATRNATSNHESEELKMYWECPACTCANFNGDTPSATCEVCGTPRRHPPQSERGQASIDEATNEGFEHMGLTFSRPFDIYSEKEHPHAEEDWFVELVGNVLRLLYPPEPEDKKLPFTLFLPTDVLSPASSQVRLLGLDQGPKDKRDREKMDTFKEVVAYRSQKFVNIYALVSHGRRMYRKLIFTSKSEMSHHGFSLTYHPDAGPQDPVLLRAAGDCRERQLVGGTLVILRKSRVLGGVEQYIPPRLLQGLMPSCLLEAFVFWMGEDGNLRGDPLDTKSQWFRYRLQVVMMPNGNATITRSSIKTSFSRMAPKGKVVSSEQVKVVRPPPAPVGVGSTSTVIPRTEQKPIEIRDDDVVQLMAMGFSYAGCCLALQENHNEIANAAQWLLDERNQAKISQAEATADSGELMMTKDELHEQAIGLLMSLEDGPSRTACEYALSIFSDDVDLAQAWLSDPHNADEIDRVNRSHNLSHGNENLSFPTHMNQDAQMAGDTFEVIEESNNHLTLMNIIDAAECDHEVEMLMHLLTKVEDLSHVLIWCSLENEHAKIHSVELPRLKLKLIPQACRETDSIRLGVADQNGWFLSDIHSISNGSAQHSQYLQSVLKKLPGAWMLESDTGDLKIICPNHDLYRPRVQGEPLGNLIVSDRSSAGWQQAMETRFYSYPIHSSRTFFLPPSLSSTLYLILTNLLAREYDVAMDFISGCNIDVKFTDEEKWIFEQLGKTLDDRHPNACACRIRLSLSISYSENKAPWKMSSELHDYLSAASHVSMVCKLSVDEENDALTYCHQLSSLLALRKSFCEIVGDSASSIDFKLSRGRAGGQPWMKLRLFGRDYLCEHGKKMSTVRYNRPKHSVGLENAYLVDDEEAIKLVWNCAVVGDEISGSNRGLGYLFLYECLNGQVRVRLGGEDCSRSFGDLSTRFLHLKLSRWGRETVEEGEEDATPSWAIAQLAIMIAYPYENWPMTPADAESSRMLSFGANLYSKMTFGSLLKSFFEFGDVQFQEKLASDEHQHGVVADLKLQFARAHSTAVHTVSINPKNVQRGSQFEASNALCTMRSFDGNDFIDAEFPLQALDVQDFITFCDPDTTLACGLPFNLTLHPAAQSAAARELLQRLGDDVEANAKAVNGSKDAFVVGVTPLDVSVRFSPKIAFERVEQLISLCERFRQRDRLEVDERILMVENRANQVREATNSEERAAIQRFTAERRVGLYPHIRFDYLTSLMSSTAFEADIRRRNPFALPSIASASFIEDILAILILCNRIVHVNRTIHLARALLLHLQAFTSITGHIQAQQTLQASKDLADTLLSKRHYLQKPEPPHKRRAFDPRFLVFEYVFDILLRKRQVQMIESFLASLENGESRVQQMIMGAGKTTVVGPLLTFILANKENLVMHVMPTALLEQSRQVLRSRFSNAILRKRIFTFEFDRSVADDPELAVKLFEKLNRARLNGDVVCASPESIKSTMLKLVELLHSLEESSNVIQLPASKASQNLRRIRRVLEDRSAMADELYKTIRLWQGGILIMDEVDVLLHPLRSELNFPIGNKYPIDLAANRWELPIFLIDAVLPGKRSNTCDDSTALVEKLHDVLSDGYASHALQRFPHLVLLDFEFYESKMMPVMTELAVVWLSMHFTMGNMDVDTETIKHYLRCPRQELHDDLELRSTIEANFSDVSIKLMNLTRDWIRTILPHVLSKINRVSYGLLRGEFQAAAMSGSSGGNSHSRLLLAVPFVGKDVPSRSSEFAHPDVLIGLTILAYRYEGLRVTDLIRIVSQLKQDFSRQLGPRDQRPACAMFRDWVKTGLEVCVENSNSGANGGGVLPLPLFQLRDASQVARLHFLVSKLAGTVHYYVRQHVFPSCMNFQRLKISACGHELGSDSLFAKRIGFSGTPSNLLPLDLGQCYYEPLSDGSIFHSLTNAQIVSIERKVNWTAKSLLLDIARSEQQFHALIDTGALITGFENHEVAAFLLEHLPLEMEGVVYLDNGDRQMILLRDHNAPMPLVQCGLSPAKRFTFYDQVHTTGMDIKQCVNARAVVTLGKDMTFRDYAQGAYRMRGIETGQKIHLFMIPEVENRIRHEMRLACSPALMDMFQTLSSYLILVPAWLLINSMRMESMQLIQLSLQELHNTWRKRALRSLMADIETFHKQRNEISVLGTSRLHRFIGVDSTKSWLRTCISQFREEVSYTIDAVVPTKKDLAGIIENLVLKNAEFTQTPEEFRTLETVKRRLAHNHGHTTGDDAAENGDIRLTTEVVHENEQEAEEEAEEEAEQEEQKMSAFTRDDEHPIPWSVDTLAQNPSSNLEDDDGAFYRFNVFQTHADCPSIALPPQLLVSGNFFRRRWVGLGERRVKNVGLILEWSPLAEQEMTKKAVQHFFMDILNQTPEIAPNDAAVKALEMVSDLATQKLESIPSSLKCQAVELSRNMPVYLAVVSLAEGETIRRMIHKSHPVLKISQVALRTCEGDLVECSSSSWSSQSDATAGQNEAVSIGIQCLRFFNNEMYYTPLELDYLLRGLSEVPIGLRNEFFECCLRLRRRERHLWGDTPLAKVFTSKDEWHLLSARARMQQFQESLKRKKKIQLAVALRRFDDDGDGRLNADETMKCFESFQLGYSSGEINEIIGLIADRSHFDADGVAIETICAALGLTAAQVEDQLRRADLALIQASDQALVWGCPVCTYSNDGDAVVCGACNEPSPLMHEEGSKSTISQQGWQCGNCTFINLPGDVACAICELGADGQRAVPQGKWVCAGEQGGCTFFNPLSNFYCEVCNRARPDLASVKF